MNTRRQLRQGFTLLEVLITITVLSLVSTMVFVGFCRLLMLAAQDEVHQAAHHDILTTMERLRNDVQLSTNVIKQVGYRSLSGNCLILRQPKLDRSRSIVPGSFHYVCYTTSTKNGGGHDGLVREVWSKTDAKAPLESEVINANICLVAFSYDGAAVSALKDTAGVRSVAVALVSGRSTGLRVRDQKQLSSADDELDRLRSQVVAGVSLGKLRLEIDAISKRRSDLTLVPSVSAAFLRNHKTMGLAGV